MFSQTTLEFGRYYTEAWCKSCFVYNVNRTQKRATYNHPKRIFHELEYLCPDLWNIVIRYTGIDDESYDAIQQLMDENNL